jgi:protein-L-isoaspartate(D-aspartate) O-methyltransferase
MLGVSERDAERQSMVDLQLRRRGIGDERVLAAMAEIPRHRFVPREGADAAYDDCALSLDLGQTISQPFMVARACELAELRPHERALDVGAGSGYQAAVLGRVCAHVVGIELLPELAERARRVLRELAIDNVEIVVGDGTLGHPAHAPYDAIVVAAAASSVPAALVEQLAPGGRLVIPVGPFDQQVLTVLRKDASGAVEAVAHDPCRYVPLRGSGGWTQ